MAETKEEIRLLLVEPGEKPKLISVEHTLQNLQELVGGYIECHYPWNDPVALICCGDAKLKGSPPNRMLLDENGEPYDLVNGIFFICGLSYDDFASISDDLAEKYTEMFYWPEMLMRTLEGKILWFRLKPGTEPVVIA